jgi:hypothetical protein
MKLDFILVMRPVMMLSSTLMPEQRDVLEGAAMFCWPPCAAPSFPLVTAPENFAFLRVIDTVDDVEHRALAGPFGPMMARISCSRTLKEMSVSALTPPKRREMFCSRE